MTIQERWDATFQKLDRSCPPQRADETEVNYLRRLSRVGRRYIPAGEEIARVRFDDSLPDSVVGKFSEMMRAAVERNLYRVDNMKPGEMRAVMVVDPNTGAQQRHWVGPTSFVRNPLYGHRDCRLVTAINKPAPDAVLYASAAAKRAAFGGGVW